MNIDRVSHNLANGAYGVRSNRAGDAGQVFDSTVAVAKDVPSSGTGSAPIDNVTLSDQARALSRVRMAAHSAPDVREQLVKQLRSQVQDGRYQVEDEQVAARLLYQFGSDA